MQTLAEAFKAGKTLKPKKGFRFHCKVCQYDWVSKINNPKECPACKSRFWKTGITPTGQKAKSVVIGNKFEN